MSPRRSAFLISWLTTWTWDPSSLPAYIVPLDPPWKPLCLGTTQLALRHFHHHFIFLPYLEDLFRLLLQLLSSILATYVIAIMNSQKFRG